MENGIIPCQDSGRQTRRFQIRLEDIITFLERRGAGLLRKDIPAGIFSSSGRTLENPRQILDSGALCAFLLDRWADAPDMLTAAQAASLCGCGPSTINRWVRDSIVEAVRCYGSNLISKESLAERLASSEGQLIPARSALHEELLEEFQAEEQNSGIACGGVAQYGKNAFSESAAAQRIPGSSSSYCCSCSRRSKTGLIPAPHTPAASVS